MSIPRWICMPNLVPIGSAVWHISHILWICDPLTPSKYPLGLERLIVLPDVQSHMNLHTCVKFGPDRSSGLRQDRRWPRLVRFLAAVGADSRKNTPKNNINIKNYNSDPNMLTSTSLTFFTAIFLAFHGALAEVLLLMVMCWHSTTELYRCHSVTWHIDMVLASSGLSAPGIWRSLNMSSP